MHHLSDEDEEALQAFCKGVDFPDVDFLTWKNSHHSLDLSLRLKLSPQEAAQAGSRVLHFVRMVVVEAQNKYEKPIRFKESASCEVSWPENVDTDHLVSFPGLGDRRGKLRGVLKVSIVIS
jgi:hypothetical protein